MRTLSDGRQTPLQHDAATGDWQHEVCALGGGQRDGARVGNT